jgi:hypothetical protein
MAGNNRTAAGFIIAPMVPGSLLYFYGLAKGYGTGAIVGVAVRGKTDAGAQQ